MMFQSTPPRGGRLPPLRLELLPTNVSIHAPARGATYSVCMNQLGMRVSIHAPARGATHRPRIW